MTAALDCLEDKSRRGEDGLAQLRLNEARSSALPDRKPQRRAAHRQIGARAHKLCGAGESAIVALPGGVGVTRPAGELPHA